MGSGESFGKQWAVGDCVGVFLDLIDRTLSKLMFDVKNKEKFGDLHRR